MAGRGGEFTRHSQNLPVFGWRLDKLNLYITMALGRLRYLKNHEVDMRGNVEKTVKYMLDMVESLGVREELPEEMAELIRINHNKYIDVRSIRMPQNKRGVRKKSVVEIEVLTEDDIRKIKAIHEKEANNPYSQEITKQYLKSLMGNHRELTSNTIVLNSKEDLLMTLSAVAYAEENGYKLEVGDTYFEVENMILKSFRITEESNEYS